MYTGGVCAQRNIANLALYITMFPQLIAGPIVRYIDVECQIDSSQVSLDGVYNGLQRFAVGFSKKVLIADQLSPLVDLVFSGSYPSLWGHWAGAIAYTLQIYYDFSGYSDMAIGIGKMFGFDFLENFDYPYVSTSVKEFWRRWHISLSSWFRDYLYIPLGGNRKGTGRTYLNLLIVFFVTGLWHGASFNFIVWGLFHGFFLVAERLGFEKILNRLPMAVRHIYTLLAVIIGWVFFRADNLSDAVQYIRLMFMPGENDLSNFLYVMDSHYWFWLVTGVLLSFPLTRPRKEIKGNQTLLLARDVGIIGCFLLAISYLLGSVYSPFLYFRF